MYYSIQTFSQTFGQKVPFLVNIILMPRYSFPIAPSRKPYGGLSPDKSRDEVTVHFPESFLFLHLVISKLFVETVLSVLEM